MPRFFLALLLLLITVPHRALAHPDQSSESAPQEGEAGDTQGNDSEMVVPEGWWTSRYVLDYSLIALGAGGFIVANQFAPNPNALLGPRFDSENPEAVLDPAFSDDIGRPHADQRDRGLGETVPSEHVIAMIAGMAGFVAVEEAINWAFGSDPTGQRFHDTVVGFLEATALIGGLTEGSKVIVGRLRPDFQDRARRYICQTDPDPEISCEGVRPLADTPIEAEAELVDGRRSFFSGHSSFGVGVATYTTLVIGGRWVWNEDTNPTARSLAIVLQTAMMSTGLFIAGSRLGDARHHATDVLVGSAVGFGVANFSYWRRFDADGQQLDYKERLKPLEEGRLVPGPGNGLSYVLKF